MGKTARLQWIHELVNHSARSVVPTAIVIRLSENVNEIASKNICLHFSLRYYLFIMEDNVEGESVGFNENR